VRVLELIGLRALVGEPASRRPQGNEASVSPVGERFAGAWQWSSSEDGVERSGVLLFRQDEGKLIGRSLYEAGIQSQGIQPKPATAIFDSPAVVLRAAAGESGEPQIEFRVEGVSGTRSYSRAALRDGKLVGTTTVTRGKGPDTLAKYEWVATPVR